MRSRTLRNLDINIEPPQTAVHREDNFIFFNFNSTENCNLGKLRILILS